MNERVTYPQMVSGTEAPIPEAFKPRERVQKLR